MLREPGWNVDTEKLLCLMVLDDSIAPRLSPRAGPAFFRAFIVEDRATGQMAMKWRFRYINPAERSWIVATTDKRGSEAIKHFQCAIEMVLTASCLIMFGYRLDKNQIASHFPPDDKGDPGSVLVWLEMHDLMEMTFEREEEEQIK